MPTLNRNDIHRQVIAIPKWKEQQKIASFLKPSTNLYAIVGDKKFHTLSKPEAIVDVQELSDGLVTTKTTRGDEVMYDIFRPISSIIESAGKAGFTSTKQVEIVADYWSHVTSIPVCHLIVFHKN